ncbi:ESX secretion-associated protein EspG [Nocardia sp. NPDC058640]|uniref:ESX secretion-associated protein EspG n=1 Tax=Nocardia sp. NPDC058640 TaxID=3346571 RepID=UPI00365062C2
MTGQMMSEWNWEPDDFAALWFNEARDRFPRPLHFTSRFRYREEFDTHRTVVRSRYAGEETDAIELALDTLERAELRIEVSAETGSARSGDHSHHRVVGVRNLRHAVVAAQTVVNGVDGPIWVRQGRPELLGKGIASRIPISNPGQRNPEEFHVQDLAPQLDNHFADVARNTPRERYKRLIDRPLIGSGSAAIRIGSLHSRTEPTRLMEWFDYANDGRYLRYRTIDRIRIEPGSTDHIQRHLTQWIEIEMQRTDNAWRK